MLKFREVERNFDQDERIGSVQNFDPDKRIGSVQNKVKTEEKKFDPDKRINKK